MYVESDAKFWNENPVVVSQTAKYAAACVSANRYCMSFKADLLYIFCSISIIR